MNRLRRMRDPYFAERRDCSDRRPLRAAAALTDIIVNARASPLDSPTHEWLAPPTEQAEDEFLRHEVARLATALGTGEGLNASPLLADRLAAAAMEGP